MIAARRLQSVLLSDLELEAHIGVNDGEGNATQPLIVDIVIETDPTGPDRLDATVDYRLAADAARSLASGEHIALIETFAWRLVEQCLAFPGARSAEVTIRKPRALTPAMAAVRASGTRGS